MSKAALKEIRYCIFDPTGNITALVESEVAAAEQPAAAAELMAAEPDVEQVGYVTYANEAALSGGDAPVSLRMAGGEFCGNATMCAAALFAMRRGLQGANDIRVRVSGAKEPLTVSLCRKGESYFDAAVTMPPAISVGLVTLLPDVTGSEAPDAGGLQAADDSSVSAMITLPLVKLEGIDHIIIEPDSGFFGLKDDRAAAESLVKKWCGALGSACLGLMFAGEEASVPAGERALTPLVYVPGADTLFWENSCASGTAAAGMYLASKSGSPVDITFEEPAGKLRVESDPATGITVLHGSARLTKEYVI